ncbi:NUDIX hydrolase [Paractinoplanes ferrugineus]|uniref:NUDIX hydrolase n=1 Tax=Paractinoplanes ferrugineus TaxID=113564 RepID=UPI001EF2F372|nr:NUDIX domain-containing protein [Actinoplanes ferrugineus]
MSQTVSYRRRSARVILLDRDQHVLLLKFLFDSTDVGRGHGWVTPGGGVDAGESLQEAAARELREEIGFVVSPELLGRPVAYSSGYADVGWARGTFRNDFFFYRVDAQEVDTTGMEALERQHHAGHRWWTCDELIDSTEIIYPLGLGSLLHQIHVKGIPEQAVQLPWHH